MNGEAPWSWSYLSRSSIGPTCSECQTIHGADAVVAIGRFNPGGARGYRRARGGPLRDTRTEAMADVCRAVRGAA